MMTWDAYKNGGLLQPNELKVGSSSNMNPPAYILYSSLNFAGLGDRVDQHICPSKIFTDVADATPGMRLWNRR